MDGQTLRVELFTPFQKPFYSIGKAICQFLQGHGGGTPESIQRAMEYATKERSSFGGYVVVVYQGEQIAGVSILNSTGLDGVMPPFLLSHIAVHPELGADSDSGGLLLKKTLELSNNQLACLVHPDNPLVQAYMKEGRRQGMELLLQLPGSHSDARKQNPGTQSTL